MTKIETYIVLLLSDINQLRFLSDSKNLKFRNHKLASILNLYTQEAIGADLDMIKKCYN